MLGLFGRPVELDVLQVLQEAQIPRLTEDIKTNAWSSAITTLREDHRLLVQANNPQDEQLDCHPLISAYFACQLQNQAPDAWQAAHTELYDCYKIYQAKSNPTPSKKCSRSFAPSPTAVPLAYIDKHWKKSTYRVFSIQAEKTI